MFLKWFTFAAPLFPFHSYFCNDKNVPEQLLCKYTPKSMACSKTEDGDSVVVSCYKMEKEDCTIRMHC